MLHQVLSGVKMNTGKQLRPLLTMLSAKMVGEVTTVTHQVACILELLHNVSLLHDDVVDEALERRGKPSANALHGNKVAVLSGDYLLAKVFDMVSDIEDRRINHSFSILGQELSDGEIMEMTYVGNTTLEQAQYIDVIYKKTAILFKTCMYVGALSGQTSMPNAEAQAQTLAEVGEALGICFQIRDDLFDYVETSAQIGKPIGNDARERKVTQPLICALRNAKEEDRKKIVDIFATNDKLDDGQTAAVIRFVHENGGIEATEAVMQDYVNKGKRSLASFPSSQWRDALEQALDFVVIRNS